MKSAMPGSTIPEEFMLSNVALCSVESVDTAIVLGSSQKGQELPLFGQLRHVDTSAECL